MDLTKSIVEQEENGLVATTYINDTNKMIAGNEEGKADCFEVSILKRLKEVINPDNVDDRVTSKYIIEKLGLKGEEAEKVKNSSLFNVCSFTLKDISENIKGTRNAMEAIKYKFSTEQVQSQMVAERSIVEPDVARGMICIMPMKSWGDDGGVYAIKILSDTEKKTVIKLMLKYMDDELKEYVYSEYVTVKLSDLIYEYEGRDALKKNFGKMKKLMEYTPAGKEELNYQKLYAALCHFQKKIVTRVVDSDTLNFNDTYKILVKEVFEIAATEVGESIFGDGYYILSSDELKNIAKKAGYTLKELASMLKDRGFLETDKDKETRQQKTITRNKVKGKYYCVLTSEKFNGLCDTLEDKLSVTEEEYELFENKYTELMDTSASKQVEDKKGQARSKRSKKAMSAWRGDKQ
jgi:CHAD domain-containing protein